MEMAVAVAVVVVVVAVEGAAGVRVAGARPPIVVAAV
jgi:hypothetical protein